MEILTHQPQADAAFKEFIGLVTAEIDSGKPLQQIYSSLLSNGASADDANVVISAATGGKMRQCPECKLVYSDSLSYCSNCGNELIDVEGK